VKKKDISGLTHFFLFFIQGAPVAFAEANITPGITSQQYLLARICEIQGYLMTTWVFRDNAINCELGFLLYQRNDSPVVDSNFVAHLYSTTRVKV
jgi:hypothetical protein